MKRAMIIAALLFVAQAGLAESPVLLYQSRSVSVATTLYDPNSGPIPVQSRLSASSFDVFQADVLVDPDHPLQVEDPNYANSNPAITASAGQYSDAQSAGIVAYGWSDCESLQSGFDATASSPCRVRFVVTEPTRVVLNGIIALSAQTELLGSWHPGHAEAHVAVRLTPVTGAAAVDESIDAVLETMPGASLNVLEERPVSAVTELPMGMYDLQIDSWTTFTGNVSADLVVTYVLMADFVTLPPPTVADGDLDHDGDVDIADLARLQQVCTGPQVGQ